MKSVSFVGRFLIALLLVIAGLPALTASAAPARADPVTWTVLVGGETGMETTAKGQVPTWAFMRFYPDKITINVGDTILFKLNSMEIHTVTFPKAGNPAPDFVIPEGGTSQRMLLNPLGVLPQGGASYDGSALVGSGQLGGTPQNPTQYKLTFTAPGTFAYVCTFHPMMKGTVIVQAAGSAYPQTQAQIDAAAKDMLAKDAAAAKAAEPNLPKVTSKPGANGSTAYEVKIGYGDGNLSYMRFSARNLAIHAGDSVTFVQADPMTPHTVTLASGGAEPDLALVEPQPNGPPKLVVNPLAAAPAGGQVYSGKGYFNSGLLWGTMAPVPGPRSYTLTFDTPGTYEFYCILHDDMGMSANISVLAQGAALPAAGQAPINTQVTLLLAGLGLALLALGATAATLVHVRNR